MKVQQRPLSLCGLFELSDSTFQLFQAIELALCHRLVMHLRDKDSVDKMAIINSVAQDEDVLFYWSMNSVDIAEESHSDELPNNVISLWVTIRGFSIASTWRNTSRQQVPLKLNTASEKA